MKRMLYVALGGFLAAFFLLSTHALAASGSLYLSSSYSSVNAGNTFTVSIRENSGTEGVNVVQANLNYPSDKLDFVSLTASPTFGLPVTGTGGNGTVQIIRGAWTAVSGDQLVATVTFKAKASGSVTINFSGGSMLISAVHNNNVLNGTTGLNLSIGSGGDLNGDGAVNLTDLSFLLSDYNSASARSDVNHDGIVNINDLSILLSGYGK